MKGGAGKDPDDYKKKNVIGSRRVIWDLVMGRGSFPSSPSSHGRPLLKRFSLCVVVLISAAYAFYFINALPSFYCHHRHRRDDGNPNFNIRTTITITTPTTSSANVSSLSLPLHQQPTLLQSDDNASSSRSNISRHHHTPPPPPLAAAATSLRHIVFGIAASARLWDKRKEYIKLWWRPGQMRGYVWLDSNVKTPQREQGLLPRLRISANTSRFPYTHRGGHRSAIRISRIVSETFRLKDLPGDVRWFVMGDDDTVFVPDNLLRVLSKYDHRQPYYIGAVSESHLQNIYFSYAMAYGGGGFAISRPLAEALARMQDRCIGRYPALYGSDDRMQACMAELGVPLTKEPGFHQYDVYGNLFGLLAAHPVAPLVTLHHLDVVEPVFPNATRAAALRRLFQGPVRLDSAGVMQQSICYDITAATTTTDSEEQRRKWTVSVSWGYAVQIIRGVLSPREVEMPTRTFLNWYRRADYTAYAFNTRPVARNPCQKPFVFYLSTANTTVATVKKRRSSNTTTTTVTHYTRHTAQSPHPQCKWKMEDPSVIEKVVVYKRPDPHLWDRSPRRNCCRVLPSDDDGEAGEGAMTIEVGVCRDGEISEP